MRKILCSLLATTAILIKAQAQPILTAPNMNPVQGDFFYEHYIDTDVSKGASGMNVTWDFSTVSQTGVDSTLVYDCDSTPFCSTFPGSNICELNYGDYEYFNAASNRLTVMGAHSSGVNYIFSNPIDEFRYPFAYNAVYADTGYFGSASIDEYYTEIDSFIYDGYGTIILPGGTDTGVVRVHNISYYYDSSSSGVNSGRMETYNWYKPGMHNALFTIDYDTAGSPTGTLYVADASYYTVKAGIGLGNITLLNAKQSVSIYPNPVANEMHIQRMAPGAKKCTLSITDMTGRVVIQAPECNIAGGVANVILSVAGLPDGVYFAIWQSDAGYVPQKFVVRK